MMPKFRLSYTHALATLCALFLFCWLYTGSTRLEWPNADPYLYLHAAQSLEEGRGLINGIYDADAAKARTSETGIFAIWPPLYPVTLAALGGGLPAARAINALGLWASLLLGYALMRRYGTPASIAIGACAAFVVFMSDSQITFLTAASETLFLPLWLGWIYTLPDTETTGGLILNSLLAAAMSLTRYIGVPFAILGALYVMWRRGLTAGIAAAYVPSVLMAVWFTRNVYTVGRLTGHSLPGEYTGDSIWQMTGVLNQWTMLVIAFGGGLFCLAYLYGRWSSRTAR